MADHLNCIFSNHRTTSVPQCALTRSEYCIVHTGKVYMFLPYKTAVKCIKNPLLCTLESEWNVMNIWLPIKRTFCPVLFPQYLPTVLFISFLTSRQSQLRRVKIKHPLWSVSYNWLILETHAYYTNRTRFTLLINRTFSCFIEPFSNMRYRVDARGSVLLALQTLRIS